LTNINILQLLELQISVFYCKKNPTIKTTGFKTLIHIKIYAPLLTYLLDLNLGLFFRFNKKSIIIFISCEQCAFLNFFLSIIETPIQPETT